MMHLLIGYVLGAASVVGFLVALVCIGGAKLTATYDPDEPWRQP